MKCKLCLKAAAFRQKGICPTCFDRPFPITSVARADLEEYFNVKDIAKFTDDDMARLARVMADVYLADSFWVSLEIIANDMLTKKKLSSAASRHRLTKSMAKKATHKQS
jgi:hypothetical protein